MKNLHDKLMSRGAVSLTDAELLALLVESSDDSRDPLATAEKLLAAGGSLAGLARTDLGGCAWPRVWGCDAPNA